MSLQDLTYEINYNVDDNGLSKSVQLIDNMESSLDNFVKKVDSLGSTLGKINTSMNELSKSTSNANVDNLSSSLKNATNNSNELNSSTERLDRLTQVVNKSVDDYNSKLEESANLAQSLNNRSTELNQPLSKYAEDQAKLNDEINKSISEEDNLANSANKVVENIDKSTQKSNELKNSLGAVRTVSSGIGSILGAWGVVGIGYSLVSGIKGAIGAFTDFQQEMANVHATLGQVTNSDLNKLSDMAITLSSKWAISAKDIGSGMQDLASHGLNAKQIIDTIQPAILIATDGNIKMKDATLDLTSAIRNYNLQMSDAPHVANVYAKAAADTAADVSNMTTAMSYISPIAGQAGWSLENVSAAIGLLGDKGVLGSRAGTGLREMFSRLIKPTKSASEEMQALGFNAIDPTTHKMKDIGSLIGDLQGSLKGLNSAQKENALAVIFGQQALTPVSGLLSVGKQAIDNETNSLKNSKDAAYNMAITMNDTLGKAFEKFKINIQNAFIKNIDKTELGYSLKEFIIALNNNMPAISSEIGKLLDTAVRVGSGIKQNWGTIAPIILGVSTAFLTLKGAMKIESTIMTLKNLGKALPTVGMAGGLGLVAAGFMELKQGNTGLGALLIGTGTGLSAISAVGKKNALFGGALGIAAAGFVEMKQGNAGLGALLIGTSVGITAVGLAMKLSLGPVGVVVGLAVGALAAGAAYLIDKYGSLGKAWDAIWGGIKQVATDATNWVIGKLNDGIGAINKVIEAADKIPGIKISTINAIQYVGDKEKKTKGKNYDKASSVPAAATGMENSPGGITLVGEKGPELVNLPKGANVITASQTAQMLNSNANNKSMGTGAAASQNSLNSSTKKLLAENKAIIMDYVSHQTVYGQNSVKNFSTAVLEREPLATTATNKVSTDNKNIMSLMANSGLTYGTEMVTELGQGVKDSEGNLISIVDELANKVVQQFKTTFGIASPSKVMYQIGDYLGQGLINGMQSNDINSFITKWIGDTSSLTQNGLGGVIGQLLQPMFAKGDNKGIISMVYNLAHNGLGSLFGGGGAVSGNIMEWIAAAMALTGVSPDWAVPLEEIIEHESGGDPNNINLWDYNAQHGDPSIGLMQLTGENMRDFHLPGMDDIRNPVANIAAGIKYIQSRYGSIYNVPGIKALAEGRPYVGYAGGTNNATPGIHLVGERGPELVSFNGGEKVTPNNQLASISQKPYFAGSSNVKAEISPNIAINIYESKDPRTTAQEVLKVLKQHFGDLLDEQMGTIKLQMGMKV